MHSPRQLTWFENSAYRNPIRAQVLGQRKHDINVAWDNEFFRPVWESSPFYIQALTPLIVHISLSGATRTRADVYVFRTAIESIKVPVQRSLAASSERNSSIMINRGMSR